MKKIGYRMINENSGITLISLVVTIIVIIILASIGINTGITTLKSSQLTRFTSQMKMMQLEVNELYEKYITGGTVKTKEGTKFVGEGILNIGKELTQADQEQISKIFRTTAEGGSNILDETGYRYFDTETISSLKIDGIDQEFLVNVQKRSFISFLGFKYNNDMYYTLEQLPDGLYNVGYINPNTGKPTFDVSYDKLTNGKWKININNIKYEEGQEWYITKWNVKYQLANTEKPDKWYTSEELSFIVDTTGKYRILIYQQDVQSQIVEIDISDVIPPTGDVVTTAPTTPVDKETIFQDTSSGNKEAVIPEGFHVSGVPEEQKIDKGLVVIAPDGSEFVWVPVDKKSLCVDGIADKEVAEIAETTPEGVKNYRGQLYNFSETTSSKRTYSESSYREPAYLTDSTNGDANTSEGHNTIGITKELLQDEYNAIINSIKEHGGFYIGRYESSLSESNATTAATTGHIQSKKGIMPTSAANEGTKTWYGLYQKQKEYATVISQSKVKSGMIYGSMYDAVMNWALSDEKEKNKVTASSTNHGPEKTGALESDVIKNIYDLGNNLWEWTAEALITSIRVLRGGYYNSTISASVRDDGDPSVTFGYGGSGSLLYL